MSNQINAIESHVDQIWNNLRIYRLPLHLALFVTLSTFEDYLSPFVEKPVGIAHLRGALGLLVPELFRRCPTVPIKGRDIASLRGENLPYIYAMEAMSYAQRYSWIAYHLTCYRQRWFDCQVEERIIRFSYTSKDNPSQSLMYHRLKQYHEDRSKDNDSIQKIYKESPRAVTTKSLELALRHVSSEELLYSIPPDVFQAFRKLVIASSPTPTIEQDITFSGYTVQEYYDFWVDLSALMLAFLEACDMKYGKSKKRLMNSRLLLVEPSKIADTISKLGDVSLDSSEQIVKELVLDVGSRRPDIQVQHLIPANVKDLVFLSPHLIFTSQWEVCLLRNWAKLSPSKYGQVVASKKVKLANQLALLLNGPNVKKAINKRAVNSEGDIIGDVDLAVFDSIDGYLALIQLKWVIEPDSFQEESNAKEELLKGIEQLRKCIGLFTTDRDSFMLNLFPQDNINPEDVTDVQSILMCRGTIDTGIDANQFNIDVLDYEMSFDFLKENHDLSIRERFRRIVDLHSDIQGDAREKIRYNGMKIAGYLCQTPGLARSGQSIHYIDGSIKSYPAKKPCFCGSGMRYRDCCKLIESLDEGDFAYEATTDGSSN